MGSIIGGLVGQEQAKPYEKAAEEAAQQALETITGIPDLELDPITLERLQSAGVVTPEMIETITQGPSAMEGISTDPRLAQAQMKALENLSQLGEEGLTAVDRAALNEMRRSVETGERGRQGAILQDMAARGMGGSGAELAARLSSSQAATERAASEADRLAAMAQQNRLAALSQAGQLGGQIRGQEFGEKSAIAQAQDAIARFNAANKQQVAAANVGARNLAQQFNLQSEQDRLRYNNEISRLQEMYNKGQIPLSEYNAAVQKAQLASGAYQTEAGRQTGLGQQALQQAVGIGQGVDKLIGAGAGAAIGGAVGGPMGAMTGAQIGGNLMGANMGTPQMPQQKTTQQPVQPLPSLEENDFFKKDQYRGSSPLYSDKKLKQDISSGDNSIEMLLDKLAPKQFEYKNPMNGEGVRIGVMAQDAEKSPMGKQIVNEAPQGKEIDMNKAISVLLAAAGNMHNRLKKMEGK